ncbi:hypothetical protein C447_08478 [Halococcus hamelinensis 100A6]|uniref:Uncharacterized protein n=2 Tax=Halococcus hamelinensis TaxID=332168 RepID=M0M2K5_9EURY|nr:hypothetical protein C447_08478 [Halococcus hamelinensis 100A6]
MVANASEILESCFEKQLDHSATAVRLVSESESFSGCQRSSSMVTKHDIRNGIRGGVGRFKREVTASFTKEELGALCAALEITGTTDPVASTATMRQQIRVTVGLADSQEDASDDVFSKRELESIAAAIGVEPVSGDEPDPLF